MSAGEYYIEAGGARIGPLDYLSLIRRIRRGQVQRDTLIDTGTLPSAVSAYMIPELKEVFDDQVVIDSAPDMYAFLELPFFGLLRDGYEFFKFNQIVALMTGVFWLVAALLAFGLMSIPEPLVAQGLTGYIVYLIFMAYLIAMLRKSRMQLLPVDLFIAAVSKHALKLCLIALITLLVPFFVPMALAELFGEQFWFLALFPGTLVWTYFFFLPFVIDDLRVGVGKALAINHRGIRKLGFNNFTTVYGLIVLNILLAPLVIPLLILLPITVIALCEAYDAAYN